jgi:hypothetical protein
MSNVRELTNAELDFVGGGDFNVDIGSLVFLNDFEHANIGTVGTTYGDSIGLKIVRNHHKMVV